MNILALADEESSYLWDYYDESKLKDVDLILSCGDLSPQYLSFLATLAHCPVLYVHGNHDGHYKQSPRRAVSALKIRSTPTRACAFWDWAAACNTVPVRTSIQIDR